MRLGRPARYTLIPMVFVTGMAFLSALHQLWSFYESGNYLLLVIDLLIVAAALSFILESGSALARSRRAVGLPVSSMSS